MALMVTLCGCVSGGCAVKAAAGYTLNCLISSGLSSIMLLLLSRRCLMEILIAAQQKIPPYAGGAWNLLLLLNISKAS